MNLVTPDIVKEIQLGKNVYGYFTIIKIKSRSEKSVAIYNGILSSPIIEIDFEKVIILEKENFPA